MIAKHSRPKSTAVAGYDLTFSPVKSVSTLWAVAAPPLAARIERAHQAAVKDALAFIEDRAFLQPWAVAAWCAPGAPSRCSPTPIQPVSWAFARSVRCCPRR